MTAIYARQSVDRRDSISIDAQIAACRQLTAEGDAVTVYADRGYSGKNMERPAFQEMMAAVRRGEIHIIIVYKLDRISRSLIDFVGMMDVFAAHGVTFTSRSEQFDTGTDLGLLLLKLLMLFAEMERKTIQQRVTDNYYARGEQRMYLGGCPPFGYAREEVLLDGRRTWRLVPEPEQAQIVRELYRSYAAGEASIGALVRALNAQGVQTGRQRRFGNSGVARILRSPVYVRADAAVYAYLSEQGAALHTPPAEFDGVHGCTVYGNKDARAHAKFVQYQGEHVVLGLHEGLVSATCWLACQRRAQSRGGGGNAGTGQTTWLQGLVRCARCGSACYAKRGGKDRAQRYWICSGKRAGICEGFGTVNVARTEAVAETVIRRRLLALRALPVLPREDASPARCAAEAQLAATTEKCRRLADAIVQGGELAQKHLSAALSALDQEREEALAHLQRLALSPPRSATLPEWDGLSFARRHWLAGRLLHEIRLSHKNMDICLS